MKNKTAARYIDEKELREAGNLIKSLLLLLKTYALYSPYHPFCEKMLAEFHSKLSSFLGQFDTLLLSMQKHSLLYEGEEIHSGPANEENLAFSFFRDGIEWIEIVKGIEFWETGEIIKILHTYKRLPEEAEGDFVTAFWELELPHFHYEASEFVSDDEFKTVKTRAAQSPSGQLPSTGRPDLKSLREKHSISSDSNTSSAATANTSGSILHPTATELTSQETRGLDQMLVQDDELDPTREIVRMLSDIFNLQEDRKFFDLTLDFLKKILEEALIRSRFDNVIMILQTVHAIRERCLAERQWALPVVEDFLETISGSKYLEIIQQELNDGDTSYMEEIKQILLLMPPQAIKTLSSMVLEIKGARSKEMVKEVLTVLAQQDCKPIEPLLKNASDDVLILLIGVLEKVPGNDSKEMLLTLIHHKSEIIRKVVLKTLVKKQVWDPTNLFSMIDDVSASVRKAFLDYLGTRRCTVTEKLLMDYLMKNKPASGEQDHYLECFKVLGLCGSKRSIPFLRTLLLEGTVLAKCFGSTALRGAGIALSRLDDTEAQHILQAAARSYYPGLRRSVESLVDSD